MLEQAKIVVRVQPRASQNKVVGFKEGVLHIRIAAPPVEGKANRELIDFLSEVFGVSKSSLTLQKGSTSKVKTIAISGLTQDRVTEVLEKQSPCAKGWLRGAKPLF